MCDESISRSVDELLFQYVGLKTQVRALQHDMRAIYPSVVEAMRGSDEQHDVGGAIVNYRTRKSYKFSEKIRSLAEELKIRKTLEIQTEVAEVESETEIIFVRFKKAESRQD